MIYQKDALMPESGLLTIGFQHEKYNGATGISWSMPLAHLRYYGKPVKCSQSLHSATSRISFRQVLQVAIGSLASQWGAGDTKADKVTKFLLTLLNACMHSGNQARPWLAALADESLTYITSNLTERHHMDRFLSLGRRRPEFLAEKYNHPLPCLGLSEPQFFLQYMTPDQRVQALRNIATKILPAAEMDHAVIQSYHPVSRLLEYTSVVPQIVSGLKSKSHRHWILLPLLMITDTNAADLVTKTRDSVFGTTGVSTVVYEHEQDRKRFFGLRKDAALQRSIDIISQFGEPCGFLERSMISFEQSNYSFYWSNPKGSRSPVLTVEELRECANRSGHYLSQKMGRLTVADGWQVGGTDHSYHSTHYVFVCGDPGLTAIYRPMSPKQQPKPPNPCNPFSANQVTSALEQGCFEPSWLVYYLERVFLPESNRYANYFSSLEALGGATEIYSTLPNAQMDLNFKRGLHSFAWANTLRTFKHNLTVRQPHSSVPPHFTKLRGVLINTRVHVPL